MKLTDRQRQELCVVIGEAFVEIRMLGREKKAEQARDLADAFHNLPHALYETGYDLKELCEGDIAFYQEKYPTSRTCKCDYVAKIRVVLAMNS